MDTPTLQIPSTKLMCMSAFSAIITTLNSDLPIPSLPTLPLQKAGLFITWTVPRSTNPSSYTLRGCIGTLSPASLQTAIPRYARQAAFHDARFAPIAQSELSGLVVAVSVLSAFERVPTVYDWVVGLHGIVLELPGGLSATYLPEVALEQGWGKEKCLRSLAEKAGFRGGLVAISRGTLTTFRSSKTTATFPEYLHLTKG